MQWEQWRNNSDALVAGPIPAGEYTTLPVALQPSDVALQVYLGANRGLRSHCFTAGDFLVHHAGVVHP